MSVNETQLKAWAQKQTRNYDQLCQALMWQVCHTFGSTTSVPSSAIAAYRASKIVSRDVTTAPAGAFVYYNIGVDGHVALSLGGGKVFMASAHVEHMWGVNTGSTTSAAYMAATGAKPLGWSWDNAGNKVELVPTISTVSVGTVVPVPKPAAPFVLRAGESFTSDHAPIVVGNYRLAANGEKNIIWSGLVGKAWLPLFQFKTGIAPGNPKEFSTWIVNQNDQHLVAYAKKVGSIRKTARWAGPANWRRLPKGTEVRFESTGHISVYAPGNHLVAIIYHP